MNKEEWLTAIMGHYVAHFQRKKTLYVLRNGYYGREMSEPEIMDMLNAICESIRQDWQAATDNAYSEDMFVYLKENMKRVIFGAQRKYWTKL